MKRNKNNTVAKIDDKSLKSAIETILGLVANKDEVYSLQNQIRSLTDLNKNLLKENAKLKAEKEAYLKKNPMSKMKTKAVKPSKKQTVEATPKREAYLKANPMSKFKTAKTPSKKVTKEPSKKSRKVTKQVKGKK